jgi:aryl-alcohol dehydrogenase-like predicted oxidoreductase
MGMSAFYGKTDDEASKKTLRKAIEMGCTFWDTADM